MSDYAYDRAFRLGLIELMNEIEKREFCRESQEALGAATPQQCDDACSKMDDDAFRDFVDNVKRRLRKRRKPGDDDSYASSTEQVAEAAIP